MVRDDFATWQRMNVVAFLATGLASAARRHWASRMWTLMVASNRPDGLLVAESCRCEVAAASEGDCRVRFQNHVVPHCSQASVEFMEHSFSLIHCFSF
ncbi:hypothetical protein ACIQAL_30730 [Pseudomonas sp. NPDC088368]|uniref:hypothetical protein n=1 Tax=Pseudomonas sp. NPDC088368 TaxID=3364453 RepID=UPI0038277C9B